MASGEDKTVELKEMKNGKVADEDEAGDDEQPVVVAPDGGWGWVVMIASFCCNVIVDGIIFSFGLVVTNLADSFDVSVASASWVASLLAAFYMFVGPFVSSLANKFGFRTVSIAGSVLAGASFAVAFFATSVEFLYVFIGVLGGIGFGLVYVPAVVAVGFYFEKRRALATGIAVCGSGIGTFVLAPLTTWLLEQYGWRGTLLIFAGLVLNCAVFGALFRPLEPVRRKKRPVGGSNPSTPLMQRIKRARDEQRNSPPDEHDVEVHAEAANFKTSSHSLDSTGVKLVAMKTKRSSTMTDSATSLSRHKDRDVEKDADKEVPLLAGSKRSLANVQSHPMDRDDAFYAGSLNRIPQYRQNPDNYVASVTRIPDIQDEGKKESAFAGFIALFKSHTFNLLCFSSFITFAGFFVPFMFLAARATDYGVDTEKASFLLSIIGISNTIGRVVCGAISDHPKVNVLIVNNAALTLGGISTILTPFFPAYEMLILYAALFGLSIACFASLRSILLVELLGLENLTNAFGLILLFSGISAMLGGPMAGEFYELTQSYDAAFFLSGSMILLSGILCYPLGLLNRWEKRRKTTAVKNNKQQVKPVDDPQPATA